MFVASQKLVEFDGSGKLWQLSQGEHFDVDFTEKVQQLVETSQSKVIHFTATNCQCNTVAKEHIESVEKLARQHGFNNVTVNVAEHQLLLDVIPATPAVAVFDDSGELIYLGPYSAGYSCNVGSGIVESYVSGKVGKTPSATILSETKGCYCPLI